MAQPALDIDGLNAVLATALDAVVVMDTAGIVRGWNAVAEETFGCRRADVIGLRMSAAIIPDRHREAHERGLTHFLATGEGPVLDQRFEIEALHAGGHEIPVELSITYTEHFGQPLFLGFLRDISERKRAEETRKVLIGELNHRIKNLLGVVSSIAHQSLRSARSPESFAEDFTGRLAALARSHEILTNENWQHGSLGQLITLLVEPVDAGDRRIAFAGPEVALAPKDLLAVSMILHELLTNAVKYGALAAADGRLNIAWSLAEGALLLEWREAAPALAEPPSRRGFGMRMIEFSARHDLNGSAHWNWTDQGLFFALRFIPRVADET